MVKKILLVSLCLIGCKPREYNEASSKGISETSQSQIAAQNAQAEREKLNTDLENQRSKFKSTSTLGQKIFSGCIKIYGKNDASLFGIMKYNITPTTAPTGGDWTSWHHVSTTVLPPATSQSSKWVLTLTPDNFDAADYVVFMLKNSDITYSSSDRIPAISSKDQVSMGLVYNDVHDAYQKSGSFTFGLDASATPTSVSYSGYKTELVSCSDYSQAK